MGAIERRKDFNQRIKYLSCCNYYILAEHMSDSQIARFLSKYLGGSVGMWTVYVSSGGSLFSPILKLDTASAITVNNRLWQFYRATRSLIRCIMRRWAGNGNLYNSAVENLYKGEEMREWIDE